MILAWRTLTNFGDIAVTLPLAIAIGLWLAFNRDFSAAKSWISLFGAATLLVALSKIAFAAWGLGIPALDFTCISGHTMLATAVFPVALYLALSPLRPPWAKTFLFAGLLFAALIGYSRLALNAHSTAEVIAGFVCGLAVSTLFFAQNSTHIHKRSSAAILLLSTMLIMSIQFGSRIPAPEIINKIALKLTNQPTLHFRPKRA